MRRNSLYFFSPTFGFIIGFVFAAYLVSFLCERGWDRILKKAILAMLIGNVVLYITGLLWLARFVESEKILAVVLYRDTLKLLLAGSILPLVWKMIKRKND